MSGKTRLAVVLFNLGGPDGPRAVQPFLFNLFNDPAIIGLPGPARWALAQLISRTRRKGAQANYDLMGGASPLLPETQAQAEALQTRLSEQSPEVEARVFIAMRYWRPFTAAAAAEVAAFAPDDVVLLPLYPQFSTTTTGSSVKAWQAAYRGPGKVHAVCCYPDVAGLAEAHARRIRTAWRAAGSPPGLRLLFSAHGLPEKIVAAGDPYQVQVEATAKAVVTALGDDLGPELDWQVCYQSRVGPLKWIGPSTVEALGAAAGEGKGVIVSPIAFVSEHVETLVELDHEYGALAKQLGCPVYIRVPALGIDGGFIDALAEIATGAVARTGPQSACGGRWCGKAFGQCPAEASA